MINGQFTNLTHETEFSHHGESTQPVKADV